MNDEEMKADPGENQEVIEEKDEIETVVSKPKAKKRRKRKRQIEEDEEFNELKRHAKNIQEKFASKKSEKRGETNSYIVEHDGEGYSIHHSTTYNNCIEKAREQQMNKYNQMDLTRDTVEVCSRACGLCGLKQYDWSILVGALFGPYYVRPPTHIPAFIRQKKEKVKYEWIDLWFHLPCLLWAPGIFPEGNELPGLQENIEGFWEKHCSICSKEGALIEFGGQHMHYPCAKAKGYVLDEELFLVGPPCPKKKNNEKPSTNGVAN